MSGERAHALLSASGAHRWLKCTPSARLEDTLPERTSEYAEEGRLAHELAELRLRKHFIEPMGVRKFNNRVKKFKENPLWQDEMLKHTETYLEYLKGVSMDFSSQPYVAVEKKLNFSTYVPEGFGTGDCIMIHGSILYVVDFKYGKGVPVSAENNVQMMLYALGAYAEYLLLYPITEVRMVIVQPRLDSISEWVITVDDLLAWGNVIKPIAQTAFAGEGEFAVGEHCKFCRAKSLCRARAEFNTGLEEYKDLKPPLISNVEVGELLIKAKDLAKWAADLEEYALSACLQGEEVPGWKAVHGRSSRKFTDMDAAFKILMENDIEEAILYERKPLTLAKVEKTIGKAKFGELLNDYVEMPPGKPTLVPENDKREPIKQISAEDDFKKEETDNE